MRANIETGYYSSFVVKIWVNEGNDAGMLRGQIHHVGTQESAHFLNFDKMMEFIMSHLNPPSSGSGAADDRMSKHTKARDSQESEG